MLAAIAAADLSKRLTKALVRRTRPHVFLDEAHYDADTGGSAEKPEQSFPSGHTAGSVAVARALSRNFPAAGAAAGTAAVGIGISRIAKGAHWPLDVLGGAVIGLAAEAIAATLLRSAASALLKRGVCVALLKHRQ
jgi:membrane-associated phospholipid phosphatase